MHFDIPAIAARLYERTVTARALPGEKDLNYHLTTTEGQQYVLKIAAADEKIENLVFQNALMAHLRTRLPDLEFPRVIPSVSGEDIATDSVPGEKERLVRLLTWVQGRCWADVRPHDARLLEHLGTFCGRLSRALADFDHPAAHRYLKWDPAQAGWTAAQWNTATFADESPAKATLARHFIQLFDERAVPRFPHLRQSVTYNDANDYNILVGAEAAEPHIPAVIDFGDAVWSYTVNDLAIAAVYATLHHADPLTAMAHIVRGYHRVFALTEEEIAALFPLIGARLLISVTCSAINLREHPENTYLQVSDQPAWALLEKLRTIHPDLAESVFRDACGLIPCRARPAFDRWLQEAGRSAQKPIVSADLHTAFAWLDLSVGSTQLGVFETVLDVAAFTQCVDNALREAQKPFGIGRYNEVRPIYTTDAYLTPGNDGPQWRTVHIGLDLFMPDEIPLMAPLDGRVHSFRNNANDRDYGPTIILEHRPASDLVFYTLYGHLTEDSLEGLSVGKQIAAGTPFCRIGALPVNGNWPPHLHFQVMLHTLGMEGDFPGVVFPHQRSVWTSICPDPWHFLTGVPCSVLPGSSGEEIARYRQQHFSKNLSLSYEAPLHILRGYRQYLFDHQGRRYLDTVNNVAHVGHEHPKVVEAGQRQMAVLNTNTRYLHGNLVQFAESLLATVPPPLEVVFLVNSGSEANELALRLARTYTGRRDVVVVQSGYHGNTNACVETSSYKFDGKGGRGAAPHIHVVPLPDTYRGRYRQEVADAGLRYAQHVQEATEKARAANQPIAAFLCESVISCGGQIPLPEGYLAAAYACVRAAGGVCIADEVQTGCGRAGTHFWAFEAQGTVPDILTIGKPIGNGHPIGAVVTTRAIADAFANGMEYFNTFGGNPVSCAIGSTVLRIIREEGLQENALAVGAYLREGLWSLAADHPVIGDVRGPGLFCGFELSEDPTERTPATRKAQYLANRMRQCGILMSTDGPDNNVLKIKPPMVFGKKDADFLIESLRSILKEDTMRQGM